MSAPDLRICCTAVALSRAGGCVRSQSGWPKPARAPAISKASLAAKVSPASGPDPEPFSAAWFSRQKAPRGSFGAVQVVVDSLPSARLFNGFGPVIRRRGGGELMIHAPRRRTSRTRSRPDGIRLAQVSREGADISRSGFRFARHMQSAARSGRLAQLWAANRVQLGELPHGSQDVFEGLGGRGCLGGDGR